MRLVPSYKSRFWPVVVSTLLVALTLHYRANSSRHSEELQEQAARITALLQELETTGSSSSSRLGDQRADPADTPRAVKLPCGDPATPQERRMLFFFGTRPEVIKLAPVIHIFRERATQSGIRTLTVFTGQHIDLIAPLEQFWDVRIDLHISATMERNQTLAALTEKLTHAINAEIEPCPRDIWVVQGDTTSAFVAGLVAFYRGIAVIHVEAGLRTYDMEAPFPEEFNRRAISLLASLHFAPTNLSRAHLLREGVPPARAFVTGNTGIDAVRIAEPRATRPSFTPRQWAALEGKQLVLVTLHRREKQGTMRSVYEAIQRSVCPGVAFIVPIHPNPAAAEAPKKVCAEDPRFVCVPPQGYGETHWLLKRALMILTDSGGCAFTWPRYGVRVCV